MGFILNKNLFIAIINTMYVKTRFSNYITIFETSIRNFTYNVNEFEYKEISPTLLLSWISLVLFLKYGNNTLIKLAIFSYLIIIIFIKYCWFYSWIPIYPFFSISLSFCILKLYDYIKVKLKLT